MNTNDDSPMPIDEAPVPPDAPSAAEVAARPRWFWTRRILAGNPFYLVSAALLLLGINRLSIDPEFLGAELPNLVFNFSALQLYEVMLVLVAIILARRGTWYDSMLLIGLENLLVLVPFILVTQALLIGNGVASALCLAGTIMAVLRFSSLRRFIPDLNLPPRLLCFGGFILLVNLAVPLYFRSLLEDANRDWETVNEWCWLAGLPLLQLLANILPHPKHGGEIAPQRSWLPIGLFELWIAATAVHLWCIAYVAKVACAPYLLAPLIWALAWTFYHRIGDLLPEPTPAVRTALLFPPCLAPLLGAFHENSHIFLVLTFLNILLYGRIYASSRNNIFAFQLLLVSSVALIGGLPLDFGKQVVPQFTRADSVAVAFGALVLVQAMLSRRPQIGVCGAIMAALTPRLFDLQPSLHLPAQAGLIFLLAHSLRWVDREHKGASSFRTMTAIAWMMHSIIFGHTAPNGAMWLAPSAAAFLLLCYCLVRLISGTWTLPIIPAAAAVSLLAVPANYLMRKLVASPGLLAIIASFLLFALGTVIAVTKPRWHHSMPEPSNPEP